MNVNCEYILNEHIYYAAIQKGVTIIYTLSTQFGDIVRVSYQNKKKSIAINTAYNTNVIDLKFESL